MNGLSKEIADDISFGEYTTADYVLESSRSLCGPMSSIAMLKSLGIDGLREKYCTMTHWGLYLRKKLMELHEFEVINPPTFGICVLFVVSGESFRYKFEEIEKMNMTKCYRFAKYNYDFYLYCLMKSKEYKILLEYSSGYSHRNSKVFMGVLKLQSFTTSLNKILIDEFVERLNYLKKNFDKEKKTLRLVTPSNARSFKFAYNKTEKDC